LAHKDSSSKPAQRSNPDSERWQSVTKGAVSGQGSVPPKPPPPKKVIDGGK
jgi:hypothetical protein